MLGIQTFLLVRGGCTEWGSFFRGVDSSGSSSSLYRIGGRWKVSLNTCPWVSVCNISLLTERLRPPGSGPATPRQVGELSPKKVQNTCQCKVSFAVMGDLLCQEGVDLMEGPAHVAVTLGQEEVAPGPFWTWNSAAAHHHSLMLLLFQRSFHPEHFQVVLLGLC